MSVSALKQMLFEAWTSNVVQSKRVCFSEIKVMSPDFCLMKSFSPSRLISALMVSFE